MNESFFLDQPAVRVSFGVGTLDRVADEVAALQRRRVMLISSASSRAAAERSRARLQDRCVDVIVGAREHVPANEAEAAVERAQGVGADCLVAIGGGSAIGLAKAVVLQTESVIVAIPTTYSGSEMTSLYGITGADGKRTGRDEKVRPRAVIYDPDLTVSMPPEVTAASGMNALAHCVEALYAPDGSPVVSLLARHGAEALVNALPTVVSAPTNAEARREALLGAFLAGWSLGSTSMGLHHRVCHVLGGSFGISHGLSHAVLLPYVVAFNANAAREQLEPISNLFAEDLAPALRDYVGSLGLPTKLSEIGFSAADVGKAAKLVAESPVPNPRSFDIADVEALLTAACEGAP